MAPMPNAGRSSERGVTRVQLRVAFTAGNTTDTRELVYQLPSPPIAEGWKENSPPLGAFAGM